MFNKIDEAQASDKVMDLKSKKVCFDHDILLGVPTITSGRHCRLVPTPIMISLIVKPPRAKVTHLGKASTTEHLLQNAPYLKLVRMAHQNATHPPIGDAMFPRPRYHTLVRIFLPRLQLFLRLARLHSRALLRVTTCVCLWLRAVFHAMKNIPGVSPKVGVQIRYFLNLFIPWMVIYLVLKHQFLHPLAVPFIHPLRSMQQEIRRRPPKLYLWAQWSPNILNIRHTRRQGFFRCHFLKHLTPFPSPTRKQIEE